MSRNISRLGDSELGTVMGDLRTAEEVIRVTMITIVQFQIIHYLKNSGKANMARIVRNSM